MPIRLCSVASCPNRAHYRGRCAAHARKHERTINRAGKHVYNTKRWRILRDRFLTDHPLCECGAIATDVHHKQDIADGGSPYDRQNLQALCHACHSRITRRTQ